MQPRPGGVGEGEGGSAEGRVCGLLRESADYHKEVIVLKRAKLDIMARQLETRSSKVIQYIYIVCFGKVE